MRNFISHFLFFFAHLNYYMSKKFGTPFAIIYAKFKN